MSVYAVFLEFHVMAELQGLSVKVVHRFLIKFLAIDLASPFLSHLLWWNTLHCRLARLFKAMPLPREVRGRLLYSGG